MNNNLRELFYELKNQYELVELNQDFYWFSQQKELIVDDITELIGNKVNSAVEQYLNHKNFFFLVVVIPRYVRVLVNNNFEVSFVLEIWVDVLLEETKKRLFDFQFKCYLKDGGERKVELFQQKKKSEEINNCIPVVKSKLQDMFFD